MFYKVVEQTITKILIYRHKGLVIAILRKKVLKKLVVIDHGRSWSPATDTDDETKRNAKINFFETFFDMFQKNSTAAPLSYTA